MQRNSIFVLGCGLALAALVGCSSAQRLAEDTFTSSDFSGIAAADEPQAVLVGRDVLNLGGTAADAAVAMAFTMAVTLPSQVSLGSAGACLVFDPAQKVVKAITFVPQPSSSPDGGAGLVPAMPRAMFLLHARYGHVIWGQILGNAQRLATQGSPASRAFIRQLEPVSDEVLADSRARSAFLGSGDQPLTEGGMMRNPELGATLGRLALHGVGDLYSGNWAREFIGAAKNVGASFNENELRQFAAQEETALAVPYGHDVAYFAPPPALTGIPEAQVWSHFAESGAYEDAKPDARPAVTGAALARALADRAQWLEGSYNATALIAKDHVESEMAGVDGAPSTGDASTDQAAAGASLVTVDSTGLAVACEFTLNRPFGTGRMVPGFGFYLAAPGPDSGLALGPIIAINANSNEFRFAGAASGGPTGTRSLIQVAADTLMADRSLAESVAALRGDDTPGRIEAARCQSGRPSMARCAAATDPRGFGLAQSVARR
jgi:gamma-glutamyltranspeptidase/glutathione hydrolase